MSNIENNIEFKDKRILIVSHWWVAEVITWIKRIENCRLVKVNGYGK